MGKNKIIKGSIPSPLDMEFLEEMLEPQFEKIRIKEKEIVMKAFLMKLGRPYKKGDFSKFKVVKIDAEDKTLNLLFEDVLFGTVVTKITDTNYEINFIPTIQLQK